MPREYFEICNAYFLAPYQAYIPQNVAIGFLNSCIIFEMSKDHNSAGRPAIMTEDFCDFPQFLYGNSVEKSGLDGDASDLCEGGD
jgi:hypothetical protein